MVKPFHLQPLADFAQDQQDEAARLLSEAKTRWIAEQQKLEQLKTYQEEYRDKFLQSTWRGLQAAALRDFDRFLAQIGEALRQQQAAVDAAHQLWQQAHKAWLEQRRKVKAYDALAQRHVDREVRREARFEQREQDEAARTLTQREDPSAP